MMKKLDIKNLKISKKLGISFLIVLFIATFTSFNSLGKLKTAEKWTTELYDGPHQLAVETMGIRRDIVSAARHMNYAFATNDHVNFRQDVIEQFETIRQRLGRINNLTIEDQKVDEYVKELENLVAQLRVEYEKIYEATQKKDFTGSILDVDMAKYDEIYMTAVEVAKELSNESEVVGAKFVERVENINKKSQAITLMLCIFNILIGITITLYITKKLKQPISEVEIAANQISKGNFDVEISYESKDELGMLASSMREMCASINEIINDTVDNLEEVASGNFDVEIDIEYIGTFKKIEVAINNITDDLSSTISQINVASEEVQLASDQVSSGAQMLSQGTTEQAGAIEELSATISDISNKVKDTAKNAAKANVLSASAGKEVQEGNKQMDQMVKAMEEISYTSNEIGRILKTIDEIAFQTNILALNAAVEAARAGESGKGFAVVADEVRNLAAKSAEAAKNTANLIENSIKAVGNGNDIVSNTAQSLQKIIDTTNKARVIIDEIAKASEVQSSAISQVTLGIEQISLVVQTNSATGEESAAASEELSGQAQMLKTLIDNFKLKNKSENYKDIVNEIQMRDSEIRY